ncbi:hypothetical protein Bca52824_073106 [Brassica carinata]|uniref:Uncharacterized protein n=1 Tax=Brassica carinata TaxID=52824 RepID=A0A8X7U4W8_BRACI|nr:hypothetical protein Bca52824_073106 [Brassica carinata]
MVAHGCGIVMGGRIGGRASSSVMFLDCRSHRGALSPPWGASIFSCVCALGGRILWCEAHEWERPVTTHVMEWREVMGLESLRETLAASKLVNYGGRLGISGSPTNR